jgi:uncharacterized membrane-anchored protein YjiN (DUF445 family)
MAHPIPPLGSQSRRHHRHHSAVRAYTERLRALIDQVRNDPLDEARSVALVAHIVNNRAIAARLYDELQAAFEASAC